MAIIDFRGEYRWLSNFAEAEVFYDGQDYPTTEHAYQAAKTLDKEERKQVREAPTPGRARRLGQKVTLRPGWHEIKLNVMRDLLKQKFKIPEYKKLLLDTGGHHLLEGNTWGDQFWGVCEGIGENHLGRLLMDIRYDLQIEQIREELKKPPGLF